MQCAGHGDGIISVGRDVGSSGGGGGGDGGVGQGNQLQGQIQYEESTQGSDVWRHWAYWKPTLRWQLKPASTQHWLDRQLAKRAAHGGGLGGGDDSDDDVGDGGVGGGDGNGGGGKGGGEGEGGGDGDDAGGGLAHEPTQPLARQAVVLVRTPLAAVRRQAMRSLKSMSAAGSSAAG